MIESAKAISSAIVDTGVSLADKLLLPYLHTTDEAEAEILLAQLISDHAGPIIKETIRRKLRINANRAEQKRYDPHAEDIYNDVIVDLLARLKDCKAQPHKHVISDLRGYAAVIAYHVCYRYLRQKYPQRHMLKNRLRYLLTHQTGFALWGDESNELIAGFAAWQGYRITARSEKFLHLLQNQQAWVPAQALTEEAQRTRPADLLAAIFNYIGDPVSLDELVNIVAELWGIKDQVIDTERNEEQMANLPDPRPGADVETERRTFLQRLWSEILQLPTRQRAALLLNLRDVKGHDCISLFPFTGIASIRQIASALELPAVQFAELWKHLPLDDAAIAARLALSRQQVVNLRKSARARLARRMRAFR